MMQGYVNEYYEAVISVALRNAAETDPLLGMKLLKGYRLQLDAVVGGLVVVQALQ